MDIGFFLFLAVVIGILGAVGSLLWWVLMIWFVVKGVSAAQRNLDQMLPQIESEIRRYQALATRGDAPKAARLTGLFADAERQMRQLDRLHRDQYETRVSELHSMAAGAGIDWTPPTY